jgi:hypothetical protein
MDSEIGRVMQETKAFLRELQGVRGVGRATSPRSNSASELSRAELFRVAMSDTDPREGMGPAQRRVLWRLARGQRIATVAPLERVHPERARRWLATPRFQRALLHERAQPTPPRDLPEAH